MEKNIIEIQMHCPNPKCLNYRKASNIKVEINNENTALKILDWYCVFCYEHLCLPNSLIKK